jgi:hypothetical protein
MEQDRINNPKQEKKFNVKEQAKEEEDIDLSDHRAVCKHAMAVLFAQYIDLFVKAKLCDTKKLGGL